MLGKLHQRLSPATVVATIALMAALTGTALAASGALSGAQKKQVRKIAAKVFDKRIGAASVAHAASADTATKASSATTAAKATSATTATKATTAANAEKLGNKPPGDYQLKLQGSCAAPSSIEAIGQGGEVSCTPGPVKAIVMTPAAGQLAAQNLGNGFQLTTVCHDGGQVKMAFQNIGSSGATLNWLYGNGSTVSADGVNVGAGLEEDISFLGGRIEGQFIYAVGATVMTVNLHAFDGTSFCEVRGTVEIASG